MSAFFTVAVRSLMSDDWMEMINGKLHMVDHSSFPKHMYNRTVQSAAVASGWVGCEAL